MGVDEKARALCTVLACLILASVRAQTAMAQSPSPGTRPLVVSKLSDCPGESIKGCFTSSDQMS